MGIRDNVAWQTDSIHLVHIDIDLRPLSCFDEEGTNRIGFRRLLDIANSAYCRDVRDKIFALVGMMNSAVSADIWKLTNSNHQGSLLPLPGRSLLTQRP
jgi:hypothetical protein